MPAVTLVRSAHLPISSSSSTLPKGETTSPRLPRSAGESESVAPTCALPANVSIQKASVPAARLSGSPSSMPYLRLEAVDDVRPEHGQQSGQSRKELVGSALRVDRCLQTLGADVHPRAAPFRAT